MEILNKYNHTLRFRIDKLAPPKWMNRWNELKQKCESGENEHIVGQIKSFCKLESNKNLPYLDRVEGGIGGGDNRIHKQIRFRMYFDRKDRSWDRDNDIVLDQIYGTDQERWTYEELDDIIHGFVNMANSNVKETCVTGLIELENKEYDGEDEWMGE
jgi:hypothetical protein